MKQEGSDKETGRISHLNITTRSRGHCRATTEQVSWTVRSIHSTVRNASQWADDQTQKQKDRRE